MNQDHVTDHQEKIMSPSEQPLRHSVNSGADDADVNKGTDGTADNKKKPFVKSDIRKGSSGKSEKKRKPLRIRRGWIQAVATLLSNIHLPNFITGRIHQGPLKQVCVPGLNCYSCPAATASCPVGAYQAVAGSPNHKVSFYIVGLLSIFGVFMGRFICGFLCPFGWFQDLLHRIPLKKFSTKKVKPLRYVKYVMLFFVVGLMPFLFTNVAGMGEPYFCKYVCPQGVLEGGIPLAIANPGIRAALGFLFSWKTGILIAVVILSILLYRPFCKWLCPLGAFYSFFNRLSFYQYQVDFDKCIDCGKCAKVCGMDVDIRKNQAHPECIRCGECEKACPTGAISHHFRIFNKKATETSQNDHKHTT